jgi:hypothetical protein
MFAASGKYLLNDVLSRICLLRQKLIFFKWHPAFIIALVESFFDKLSNGIGFVQSNVKI